MQSNNIFNPYADSFNKEKLDELCEWISNNLDKNIGWTELIAQSNLSHTQLQYSFNKHFQTTPMTYIRRQREDNKKIAYTDRVKYNTLVAKS